eukprot:6187964-Pleurochrysis_carterae.AAC.1
MGVGCGVTAKAPAMGTQGRLTEAYILARRVDTIPYHTSYMRCGSSLAAPLLLEQAARGLNSRTLYRFVIYVQSSRLIRTEQFLSRGSHIVLGIRQTHFEPYKQEQTLCCGYVGMARRRAWRGTVCESTRQRESKNYMSLSCRQKQLTRTASKGSNG